MEFDQDLELLRAYLTVHFEGIVKAELIKSKTGIKESDLDPRDY